MYIQRGGELYDFCPAKSTWSHEIVERFKLLMICAETGVMINDGGIVNQPDWFIESLSWFLPRYDNIKFYSKASSILGSTGLGNNKRTTASANRGQHQGRSKISK